MLEGGQWMLTLIGILGDHPPTDPDGFLAFARSLPDPDIHAAVHDAQPLDDPVAFRFPASVRHRYERLARFPAGFPAGFALLGDSICSFSPIYGQGMTVAALQALALARHMTRYQTIRPRRLLRDLASVIDPPWDMVTGGDLRFPGVDGHRTIKHRLAGVYIARLHAAAAHDARLSTAFARVQSLVDGPDALLRPSIVSRVLRHRARHPATSPEREVSAADPRSS